MFARKKSTLGMSIESFESIIGQSLRIDGNLLINQCVRVDGIVNGNIFQEEGREATVAVAKGALVKGDIRAQHVIISGEVQGNIFSSGPVELLATAHVRGDIRYGTIGLEVGARITGNLDEVDQSVDQITSQTVIKQAKQKTAG
jgi:cytoskeletal protein CcmA (bactofilin family)